MRFLEIELRAFGPFTDTRIELGSSTAGLHIIFGPNEAGKSSALRAMHHLLYGIPERSSDNFRHDFKKLRLAARLVDSSRGELAFTRRKGRKKTLRDWDDREILDFDSLEPFLGGVHAEQFRTVFGIDHELLSRKSEELLRSGGSLGEVLFAAGGGLGPTRVALDALEEEAGKLYKERGTKKPEINIELEAIDRGKKAMRDASIRHDEWSDIEKGLRELLRNKEKLDEERRKLREQLARAERRHDAAPLASERKTILQKLARLQDAPALREDFTEDRVKTRASVEAKKVVLDSLDARLCRLQQRHDEIVVDEDVLGAAEEIESLHVAAREYRKALQDSPVAKNQLERLTANVEELSRGFQGDRDAEEWRADITVEARNTVSRLASRASGVQKTHDDAVRAVADLKPKVHRTRDELETLPSPVDTTILATCIRRVSAAGDPLEQLRPLQQRADKIGEQVAAQARALDPPVEPIDRLAELPAPSKSEVSRAREVQRDLEETLRGIEDALRRLRAHAEDERAGLQERRREARLPPEEELAVARKRRDALWELVARQLEGGTIDAEELRKRIGEGDDASALTAAFRERLEAADRIADALLRDAETVGELRSLERGLSKTESAIAGHEEDRRRVEEELESASASWTALWAPCGIEPAPPEAMERWLEKRETILELLDDRREVDELLDTARESSRSLRADLAGTLSRIWDHDRDTGELTWSGLLETAQELLRRLEERNRKIEQATERARELERDYEESIERERQAARALQEWRSQWEEALRPLGLSPATTVDQSATALEEIHRLDRLCTEKRECAESLRSLERIIEEFESRARGLAHLLEEPPDDLAALAARLHDELRQASDRCRSRADRSRQIEELSDELEEANTELKQLESAMQELRREAGAASDDDLPEIERRAAERRQLEEDLARLEKDLSGLAGGAALEDFVTEVLALDPDALDATRKELEEKLESIESEYGVIREEIGARQQQQKSLAERAELARAAELRQETESRRSRVLHLAERYAALRLAAAILQRGVERYRARHQAPVLTRAGQIFARLTGGAFRDLIEDVDDEGDPVLRAVRAVATPDDATDGDDNDRGDPIGVTQMSDGTRDQLYLALRLASLEHFLDEHPPMPFIVDDILVNFDDRRAAAALEALAELASRTQVILFTHHQHVVELARSTLPGDRLNVQTLGATERETVT